MSRYECTPHTMPLAERSAFSSRERLMMLGLVSSLSDLIGACECIVLTPVPLHYARHTSRLVSIFVATLPFVLAPQLGLTTVPVIATVTWALFGIQEIGLLIEDPFTRSLQLTMVTDTLGREIDETVARHRAR